MAKRKKTITKTLLNKILKESAFDPKTHPLFKVIIDEHGDDPVYLEKRSIELIREAQLSREPQPLHYKFNQEVYQEKMQKAICLAALAVAVQQLLINNG